MKLSIVGASGFIGSALLAEALERGHEVTAIVRNTEKITISNPKLTVKQGDVADADQLAELIKGSEAVISSFNAHDTPTYLKLIQGLANGVRKAGIKRVLVVSGAGSLEIAPGKQLLDTPEFPAEWKGGATATREGFYWLREQNDLDWTVMSPAANIFPGERTGKFRLGKDTLVTDAEGNSKISNKDYAVALIDEVEKNQHVKARFTAAY
ncbi:NAD(P)-dependent oxidoreductase [[Flexibacter] sp. ATCC 35208]|uniref:NAD(P)-dependent oxidoreductase n=1 Tax=[Flexibacter] sp. ATCC 35208 TaxID=1936242 RepID=UPI0009C83BBD|nr:NAD(P)-dependent oxidoreductase [[Flexibacter] sp. ATCC 35208]OMP78224.1 3-beta hydroxysteroid dehydrogenase [[Flexibacter] sp. ATCC 35208]